MLDPLFRFLIQQSGISDPGKVRKSRSQRRRLFLRRRRGAAVPVRRRRPGNAIVVARHRRRCLARFRRGRAAGAGIRVPGAGAVRPGRRAAVQSGEVADRPVCAGHQRLGGVRAGGLWLRRRQPFCTEQSRFRRSRASQHHGRCAAAGRSRLAGQAAGRHPESRTASCRHRVLRGACQGFHRATP